MSALIKTSADFVNVFCYLNPEQRTVVYEALKGNLSTLVKTSKDFSNVLCYLNTEQCAAVCETLKEIGGSPAGRLVRFGI
ncbi:MAG: hypothetical protein O7C56_01855 [Rickettsia endosymbiont of Ixodes persulcatus]|nr:hypothetical protein [Rickettsia endosymbiont of Ixodes persulcatus]